MACQAAIDSVSTETSDLTPLNSCLDSVLVSGKRINYYVNQPASAPTALLVSFHGYPRDANYTFAATLTAAKAAGAQDTLVVSPVFGVTDSKSCQADGVPATDAAKDHVWTCSSWAAGSASSSGVTSYAAVDALVDNLLTKYPTIQDITVAGFSAGAQFTQRYVYVNQLPSGARFVVSSPGSYAYPDSRRATSGGSFEVPSNSSCPSYDTWKYGMQGAPDGASVEKYKAANVSYLAGSDDDGDIKGAYYSILDKSCAATLQGGNSRLARATTFSDYMHSVQQVPASNHTFTQVPGCSHDVGCVFPSTQGQQALFGAGSGGQAASSSGRKKGSKKSGSGAGKKSQETGSFCTIS